MHQHRMGRGLTSLVRQMMAYGELSTFRDARILGVRPDPEQGILFGNRLAYDLPSIL